jgi:signal transduction histidine kinase
VPPPFVRRLGCAFAALLVLAAVGASSLVSFLIRSPRRAGAVVAGGVFILLVLIAGFAQVIRRVGSRLSEENRLRRQLLADVAHELRTPLTILQGRIEGLLDGVYPRDDARLRELLDETRHLGRLVEDLRTLANAEAGALDLAKEDVDPAELIREAAGALDREVAVAIEAELPRVALDPVRIREVLLNLLSNAARHTPEGRAIAIRAEAADRRLVVRVIDEGGGIPAEELPRVFDRFHKGALSRGTGLGLAIARDLVRAHGGEIAIESAPGRGTMVTVSLPF